MAIAEDAMLNRAAAVVGGGGCGGAGEIRAAAIVSDALGSEIDRPELQPGRYFVRANHPVRIVKFTAGGQRRA